MPRIAPLETPLRAVRAVRELLRSPPERRVVIVGAGPGGLATAMLLARAGAQVTVLEREDRVGGRTSSFSAEGFTFDLGPTFFLYPEILAEIFAVCGRDLEQEVELIRLNPMYHLIFEAGGDIRATADIDRLQTEVARISPEDAANVPAFIAANQAKFDAFRPLLQRPFSGLRSLIGRDILRAAPLMRPWATVDGDLQRWFKHPQIRLAFSFQSKYLGMSPFKCPSLFTILSHVEYGYGVFHPVGGCGAITRAMARVAADMGVDIRLSEPLEKLEFKGRRAVGALTLQSYYPADAVVLNADFAGAMQKFVPDRLRRRWRNARIEKKQFSCSTFMLYLGLEGSFDQLDHHSIHLSEDYLGNIRDIEAQRAPDDPTIYIQNASVTDPSLAPPGCSTLYLLAPVGNMEGQVDWDIQAPRYRALLLRRLSRVLGIEDIESKIRFERMITPSDWAGQYEIYRGATFNLAHNLGQMLHWRPQNRFEDLERVYLTGGGTHPGSGLPTIFESARIASRLLAEDLNLEAEALPATTLEETLQ